jgi:hypothetical protein
MWSIDRSPEHPVVQCSLEYIESQNQGIQQHEICYHLCTELGRGAIKTWPFLEDTKNSTIGASGKNWETC